MSRGGVVTIVVAGIATAVGVVIGYVSRGVKDKPEREKTRKENEALRTQLRSVLATFEKQNARMESVVEEICRNPPDSLSELEMVLKAKGLDKAQIQRIIDAVRRSHVYEDAA